MVLVRGRLIQVQEQRFRVVLDEGQAYLLTLAHDAPIDAAGLRQLMRTGQHVLVDYEGEPGLTSGVAHTVRPA